MDGHLFILKRDKVSETTKPHLRNSTQVPNVSSYFKLHTNFLHIQYLTVQ